MIYFSIKYKNTIKKTCELYSAVNTGTSLNLVREMCVELIA
jgi:hypothetical protein